MGTKIMKYIWDGGSGTSDTVEPIGYCKEDPAEVLKVLLPSYCIHSYISICTKPIDKYPANCSGLYIVDFDPNSKSSYGLDIKFSKSIQDFIDEGLLEGFKWDKFEIGPFKNMIKYIKNKYENLEDVNNMHKKIYHRIYNDFESALNHLQNMKKITPKSLNEFIEERKMLKDIIFRSNELCDTLLECVRLKVIDNDYETLSDIVFIELERCEISNIFFEVVCLKYFNCISSILKNKGYEIEIDKSSGQEDNWKIVISWKYEEVK